MSTTTKELQILERLFRSLTQEGSSHLLSRRINDLFVRINPETGEVSLFGDEDELITSTVIFSWVDKVEADHIEAMRQSLRTVVGKLAEAGYWEHEAFERPFSIDLVDEAFTTLEELLFLDNELLQLTTPLLDNLDEELSQFINDLLKA